MLLGADGLPYDFVILDLEKRLCSTTFQTWDPSEVLDTSLKFPLQALFQKGVLTLFYCKGVFSSLKPFYGNFAAM